MYEEEGRITMKVDEIIMLKKGVPQVWYNGKETMNNFSTWLARKGYISMVDVKQFQSIIRD